MISISLGVALFACLHLGPPHLSRASQESDPVAGDRVNLALGKSVTASSFEGGFLPEFAVDGDTGRNMWWGANPSPQWLEVDLGGVSVVEQVNLFTYWDGGRQYQYEVALSLDGERWEQVVDRSTNTEPATMAGDLLDIIDQEARFVRVLMLGSSANPGVHIIELEVLGEAKPAGKLWLGAQGPLGFGSQEISDGSTLSLELEIGNADPDHPLEIIGLEITGRDADAFRVSSTQGSGPLAPLARRILHVSFDPSVAGAHRAELVIQSNSQGGGPASIELLGTGVGNLLPLLPMPLELEAKSGHLKLKAGSFISAQSEDLVRHAQVLSDELFLVTGLRLPARVHGAQSGDIALTMDRSLAEEESTLQVADTVRIRGRDLEAIARGTSSLLQLIHADGRIPRVRLRDKPSFGYRALSVDVARKFHSIETLKQIVEMCRFYKVRYLGLHLTDDQNFMFPSRSFPNLDHRNVGQPAYTLEELCDLEQYAVDRGVSLIPELDVPGHSAQLVANYPDVFGALSGGTVDFRLESCLSAVKILIKEMLEVFPSSTYVHIGGDESGFTHLPEFVPFIVELNDLVRAGGRTTLMWEGFGQSSAVPKDIVIINWASFYFAPDKMLSEGYTVVNAGWDPLYVVDHYPWVQYTFLDRERIFRFDPFTFRQVEPGHPASNGITVPSTSAMPGAEMCWWEGRGPYAVPILRSRVPAFAAKLWNLDNETSFASFAERFQATDARFESVLYPVRIEAQAILQDHWKPRQLFEGETLVVLDTKLPGTIRFTVDGEQPTSESPSYSGPFTVSKTSVVSAALFSAGERLGFANRIHLVSAQQVPNLTLGKAVHSDSAAFLENPVELVVDGVIDSESHWTTFPNPADFTIDLGGVHQLDSVTVYPRWGQGYSEQYSVDVSSDGVAWTQVADFTENSLPATADGHEHGFPATPVRYVRLNTTGNSWFPAGRFPRIVEVQVHETIFD